MPQLHRKLISHNPYFDSLSIFAELLHFWKDWPLIFWSRDKKFNHKEMNRWQCLVKYSNISNPSVLNIGYSPGQKDEIIHGLLWTAISANHLRTRWFFQSRCLFLLLTGQANYHAINLRLYTLKKKKIMLPWKWKREKVSSTGGLC